MLQKKDNDTNYQFEIFYVWALGSNCDVTICQNDFAGMVLFLVGGDKVRYFLDRPCIYSSDLQENIRSAIHW